MKWHTTRDFCKRKPTRNAEEEIFFVLFVDYLRFSRLYARRSLQDGRAAAVSASSPSRTPCPSRTVVSDAIPQSPSKSIEDRSLHISVL